MSFTVKLQNNTSAKNKIEKDIRDIRTLEGTLREGCSLINPKIVFRIESKSVSDIRKCNYMTIPDFGRKYFVNNITYVRQDLVEISAHVDVLETYKDEIDKNTAIIARSSDSKNFGNTYLEDNELATYQDTYNVSYPWGYKFSHANDSLILCVAGAAQ